MNEYILSEAAIENAHVDNDEIQRFRIRKFKVLLAIDLRGMGEFMAQKIAESEPPITDSLKLAHEKALIEHRAGQSPLLSAYAKLFTVP